MTIEIAILGLLALVISGVAIYEQRRANRLEHENRQLKLALRVGPVAYLRSCDFCGTTLFVRIDDEWICKGCRRSAPDGFTDGMYVADQTDIRIH